MFTFNPYQTVKKQFTTSWSTTKRFLLVAFFRTQLFVKTHIHPAWLHVIVRVTSFLTHKNLLNKCSFTSFLFMLAMNNAAHTCFSAHPILYTPPKYNSAPILSAPHLIVVWCTGAAVIAIQSYKLYLKVDLITINVLSFILSRRQKSNRCQRL